MLVKTCNEQLIEPVDEWKASCGPVARVWCTSATIRGKDDSTYRNDIYISGAAAQIRRQIQRRPS